MTTENRYTPKPYVRPSNYIGKTWEGWLCFIGRTRDSSLLENHNFETALAKLEALPQHIVEGELSVMPVQESHWACGWVEYIIIHPSNVEAVKLAEEMADSLDGYPILDEDAYSTKEFEATCDYWAEMSVKERVQLCKETKTSIFAARHDCIPQDASYLYERVQTYATEA